MNLNIKFLNFLTKKCQFGLKLWQTNYMTTSANLLKLHERGILSGLLPGDKSPELLKMLTSSRQTIYCGFDPTADSLHVGNLLPLIVLLHCQRAGHQSIAVIGGATVQIGDPSGKMRDRPVIPIETIENNIEGIRKNIQTIFENHSKYITTSNECNNNRSRKKPLSQIQILDNRNWYKERNVIEFLCSEGRHFRLGNMLSRTSVQTRLNSNEGISLTEFMYQVFQAYDWYYLYKNYGCSIQVGGNDQTGNIVSGFEFVSKLTKTNLFGLTTPLITTTAGDKLGKTAGNAIWLSNDKTSSFDLYQFFYRIADDDVENYLKLFTFLPDDEIFQMMSKHRNSPEKRHSQKRLAEEVVKLAHGEDGLKSALMCTEALYNSSIEKLSRLTRDETRTIFSGAVMNKIYFEPGTKIIDLVMKSKCFDNINDATRIIKAGGVQVNSVKVVEPEYVLIPGQHILPNNLTIIKIGKKNYYIVDWLGTGFDNSPEEQRARDKL
ncbi:hypothetical protein HELRODRAFT_190092 [Helobdella robusta]|uniref:Tyrosine--tRNA ligase n=1 Tax=Helobdella robusta TaxID=6412 RepID=T1FRP2_HELRO|nr:hypothetical protein HELRODRAFT_190092 [Helobdella robusta]ESO10563.1 hypothetical protein HELRODRAFT_190092 [Helobdella robusta]